MSFAIIDADAHRRQYDVILTSYACWDVSYNHLCYVWTIRHVACIDLSPEKKYDLWGVCIVIYDNFRSTLLLACFCSLLYMSKCESTLSDVILYCHCIYPHGLNSLLEV